MLDSVSGAAEGLIEMAGKKKKKTRTVYRTKKVKRKKPPAKPMGLAAGTTLSGAQAGFGTPAGAAGSVFDAAKTGDLSTATSRAIMAAKDTKTYLPAAAGAVASASKNIPGLRIIARPVDRAIKSLTRGRWGL